ncbi:DUF2809 domain-containing protein [Methylobacterium sp. C25]|nr:DUF2809 domain-containing protein [Methylobacterium sp. C25]MCE4224706.1 DUF2809 domain-containing protein [Methylobacterium sp. C25]
MRFLVRSRLVILVATLAVIVLGTMLRLVPVGLPAGVVKYVGSVLWGAMVYGIVAFLMAGARTRMVIAVALAVAISVELLRLFHTPGLDAFRFTLAGQLLLGRIFSGWNILAYAAGIVAAACLDHRGAGR